MIDIALDAQKDLIQIQNWLNTASNCIDRDS